MKQIRIVLWIGLVVAVARIGWICLVRHDAHLRMMAGASQLRPESSYQSQADDGKLEITQFYARSGRVTEGDPNLICYGVRNAVSVRIEPPVENLTPAVNRCFFIDPPEDTTYTLVAEDAGGRQVSQSFGVLVKPARAAILMFGTSERQIPAGEAVTMCYSVAHARAVRMEPNGWQLQAGSKNCTRFYPKSSATYTLVATGVGGTARRAFSVTVR
jgi:hypothetical protein